MRVRASQVIGSLVVVPQATVAVKCGSVDTAAAGGTPPASPRSDGVTSCQFKPFHRVHEWSTTLAGREGGERFVTREPGLRALVELVTRPTDILITEANETLQPSRRHEGLWENGRSSVYVGGAGPRGLSSPALRISAVNKETVVRDRLLMVRPRHKPPRRRVWHAPPPDAGRGQGEATAEAPERGARRGTPAVGRDDLWVAPRLRLARRRKPPRVEKLSTWADWLLDQFYSKTD